MAERKVDALVLGGGPAGSTAATLLARAGIDTLVLEEDSFPRFHVGESLLPASLALFDELGVHDAVKALPHTRIKEGATFVTAGGERQAVYWFADAFPPAVPHAYQVRRDEFDEALLRNARAAGAEIQHGWRAVAPILEEGRVTGVKAQDRDGHEMTFRCRVVLDATGQSAFMATRLGWRFPYPMHRKVASVTHLEGVWLPEGRERGNITIVLTGAGWFWLIPFADDTVSAGAVLDVARWRSEGGDAEGLFRSAVEATPEIARRLGAARPLMPHRAIQNFSYRVMRVAAPGVCLIGDAAGFLDPIFSTGVFLATTTAASAAQDVSDALRRHGRVDGYDLGPTVSLTRSLHRLFFAFIRAYYNPHFLALFFNPRAGFQLPQAMVSLLAADVLGRRRWRRTIRFRALLALAAVQKLSARLGRPLVAPVPASPGGDRSSERA